jgi:hypothetical protein
VQRWTRVLAAGVSMVILACGGGGGGTGPTQPPVPQAKTNARYVQSPWDVSVFFGVNGSGAQPGDNLTGNFTNTTGGGFGGTLRGVLTGTLDSGTFDGTLQATTAAGCTAERRYSGPLTAASLNWTPGTQVNDCGGASPLTAPVEAPAAPLSSPPCSFTAALTPDSVAAAGGTATGSVSAGAGCTWFATTTVPWIQISGNGQGSGNGSVTLTIAANGGPSRTGTVILAGRPVTMTQAGAASPACSYELNATSTSLPAAGGTHDLDVRAGSGCAWSAASNASWLTITAGTSGTGDGRVTFSAAANPDANSRTGTLTIAGQAYTVTQAGGSSACTYTLAASTTSVAAAGGTGTLTLTTASSCAWSASSDVSWLTLSSTSGTGNATITFTAAANGTGGSRSGVISAGGQAVTVTQAAPGVTCSYAVDTTTFSVPETAGTRTVNLTTGGTCAWSVASAVPWITVGPANGTGNAAVTLMIAANSGGARSGAVTIADKTVNVSQAGTTACSYALDATAFSVSEAATTRTVNVTTISTCAWAASSSVPWITVAPSNGSGNGAVTLTIAANTTSSSRNGTATIGGQSVNVTQAGTAACSYTVNPTSLSPPGTANTQSVALTTGAACSWTATSNSPWITISPASGVGPATITLTLQSNTSPSPRDGSVTIAGQQVGIHQTSGLSCTLLIIPFPVPTAPAGGANQQGITILVSNMASVCPGYSEWRWTINDNWISYAGTGPAPDVPLGGTTDQTIRYNVAPNTGAARTGEIEVVFFWQGIQRHYGIQIPQQAGPEPDSLQYIVITETTTVREPDWLLLLQGTRPIR